MIIDSLIHFGEVQLSTCGNLPKVINVAAAGDAIGDELYFHLRSCGGAAPAGGTGVTVKLQTSDAKNFSSAVDLITATVKLEHGKLTFAGRVPTGCRKYLRVNVTAQGSFSAGSVCAFLAEGPQHSYEDLK